jgi:hypothetical protein
MVALYLHTPYICMVWYFINKVHKQLYLPIIILYRRFYKKMSNI